MTVQYKRNTIDDWKNEVVRNPALLKKKFRKRNYQTMFPSTHDITPAHLQENLTFLGNLLAAGNKILIVTKPHLDCVKSMCPGGHPKSPTCGHLKIPHPAAVFKA
jgi:hypothetical protein